MGLTETKSATLDELWPVIYDTLMAEAVEEVKRWYGPPRNEQGIEVPAA